MSEPMKQTIVMHSPSYETQLEKYTRKFTHKYAKHIYFLFYSEEYEIVKGKIQLLHKISSLNLENPI